MAMNQVQFQRGLSMAEFLDRYGTEDKCHAALVASRWPEGYPRFLCQIPALYPRNTLLSFVLDRLERERETAQAGLGQQPDGLRIKEQARLAYLEERQP